MRIVLSKAIYSIEVNIVFDVHLPLLAVFHARFRALPSYVDKPALGGLLPTAEKRIALPIDVS